MLRLIFSALAESITTALIIFTLFILPLGIKRHPRKNRGCFKLLQDHKYMITLTKSCKVLLACL